MRPKAPPAEPTAVKQVAKKPAPPRPKAREVGRAEELAMKRVTTAVKESLEIGPTLVVWIIDRTPSARDIVHEITSAALNFYESPDIVEASAGDGKPLLTSLVAFDQEVQFLIDPPTGDLKQVQSAFESIRTASEGREMTFTTIKQALEKYLPLRTRDRREVLLVVVTDEAGDDGQIG